MPIYEYKCRKCGKVFERLEKVNTKDVICACGGVADKIITSPSLYFTDKFLGKEHRKVKLRYHKERLERGL